MRLYDDSLQRDRLRRIQRLPEGPDRLQRILKLALDDVERLPVTVEEPPAPVGEAYETFVGAAEVAREVIARHSETAKETAAAAEEDVKGFLASLRQGKALPKLLRIGAREKAEAAKVSLSAAERLIEQSHDELVEAVRTNWAAWRRDLLTAAEQTRQEAETIAAQAAGTIAKAAREYSAVTDLDREMRGRYPDLAREIAEETRDGVPWYDVTHSSKDRPLSRLSVSDGKGGSIGLDLAPVILALREALSPQAFPAAEWCPPDDPEHASLSERPLDEAAPWLARAMRMVFDSTCAVCHSGKPAPDTVARTERGLVLVHAACLSLSDAQVDKLKRLRAREQQVARGAYFGR